MWQVRSSELLRRQKEAFCASKCLGFSVTLHLSCGSAFLSLFVMVFVVDSFLVSGSSLFRSIPLARSSAFGRTEGRGLEDWTLNI